MTDPHVHFRDWNQTSKETVLHGMTVGARCGFDHFFDMPNTSPPITSRENAIRRLELAAKAEESLKAQGFDVHYHLYLGVTSDKGQLHEMVRTYSELFPRVCGFKMFASQSTGSMGIIGKDAQYGIYRTLSELGYTGVLAVHCEKEELFTSARRHCDRRPAISEEASVKDQIENAEKACFKGTLHIAHVSTKGALSHIRDARAGKLIRITCGATPHHILLNSGNETDIVRMNPPLRDEDDRASVFRGLFDGTVDWIESDHAPHTLEDKGNGASGIPGFEGMLLAIKALRESGMDEGRLYGLLCRNALRAFGMEEVSSPAPDVTQEMLTLARTSYPVSAWDRG